ncbi:mannonate dehydratase [Poriferisphaera sp. WC338]|uniref:mannonate dehydratase n=1 Tax=Poriferisphaera sp. WC338 TaxID=3425129 RepID=UPI003D819302
MTLPMMQENFRWYGPNDTVSLSDIRQAGASGVFSALHQIPYGELWTREDIRERKAIIEAAGLKWTVVESVPLHEDIKTQTGDYKKYIENYKQSLLNLGAEDVKVVIYNFMPVLDWVRTDLTYKLEDGSECLYFNKARFAAFEIYMLKREEAEADYTARQLEDAKTFWEGMNDAERVAFERNVIDVFPGCKMGFTIEDVRRMLAVYEDIDRAKLKEHFKLFLKEIVPAAEEAGVRLAVHPDDPPYPIMGLPRIVSTEEDLADVLAMVDSPVNGLCFCSGSFGPIPENDLPAMVERFGSRINAVHLRSVQRLGNGDFYEANHLEGSTDMYAIMLAIMKEQGRRKATGRMDWELSFRPDHGHTMMDDLKKPVVANPGYTCIGRMRGLAELRGLGMGIMRSVVDADLVCASKRK